MKTGFVRVCVLALAVLLAGCSVLGGESSGGELADQPGYQFGDLSKRYCGNVSELTRGLIRRGIGVAMGKPISSGSMIDYCEAVQVLGDGYQPGDAVRLWCGMPPGIARRLFRLSYLKQVSGAVVCGGAG